ncbi:MAG: argininosuccinate synthase [Candidatus Adiutrix intracellularis]|jgi:argininosuccinate synthase|nr:MAG: argininosuccinate synthase [Candidatus Adiutrix intracellularis]MDR2827596.1 argininosuccinate synthase [Candidatus Adiutrix intracellularis]
MSKKVEKAKKIVLAYSGGLDTSVILKWLKQDYGAEEVVAFTADLGQGDELAGLEEKALKTGASKLYIEDLKEEFVRDFVFPAFRANAIYESQYLLGTSLARPIIAKHMVEIARHEGAGAVAHGATGKGNDQVRFELTTMALDQSLITVAPWREWKFTSRTDLIDYAEKNDIPISVSKAKSYSTDRNLLHVSFEGGMLEDPWLESDEDMFLLTVSPEKAPDRPTYIEIEFEHGDAVAVDGQRLSPASLLGYLNRLAGVNGIGRIDIVESRYMGMKCRGVYETPGGTILHLAHRHLETLTLDREVISLKDSLVPKYSSLVYNGYWYAPEREAIQALIDETQKLVDGVVRLKLYKGNCIVTGRKSPYSLYHDGYATFETDGVYDQSDAAGFIRCAGLRLRIRKLLRG